MPALSYLGHCQSSDFSQITFLQCIFICLPNAFQQGASVCIFKFTQTQFFREIFKNEDRDFLHPQTRSPRTPPSPLRVQFCEKKLTPIFLEIESMIAKTNFTLGPIEKSFFLLQLKWFTFSIN